MKITRTKLYVVVKCSWVCKLPFFSRSFSFSSFTSYQIVRACSKSSSTPSRVLHKYALIGKIKGITKIFTKPCWNQELYLNVLLPHLVSQFFHMLQLFQYDEGCIQRADTVCWYWLWSIRRRVIGWKMHFFLSTTKAIRPISNLLFRGLLGSFPHVIWLFDSRFTGWFCNQ